MIVARLKLPLGQAEYSALLKVAGDELRSPMDQVRFMLRQELERRGLLVNETESGPIPALSAQEIKQEQGGAHVTQ